MACCLDNELPLRTGKKWYKSKSSQSFQQARLGWHYLVGARNIIELYAIRGVLFVSLNETIPITPDFGRLNEMVIREITGCD